MQRLTRGVWIVATIALAVPAGAFAQKSLSWQQVRDQFQATNPTLLAGRIGIDEQSRIGGLELVPDLYSARRPHRHRRGESAGGHRPSASQSGHDDDVRSDCPDRKSTRLNSSHANIS